MEQSPGEKIIKISPSVLASDFSRLGQEIFAMEAAGADYIHLDVMDGHFVPNISFGAPVIEKLRSCCGLPFDIHLMITNPLDYIDDFIAAGGDIISFHVESASPIDRTIEKIKAGGAKPGLVLKPCTPPEAVFPYIKELAMVLVMTVEPGFGGQAFMGEMREKIKAIRAYTQKHNINLDIEVDGGIDENTAPIVRKSGANVLVAGSSLFGKPDYIKAVESLRKAALL